MGYLTLPVLLLMIIPTLTALNTDKLVGNGQEFGHGAGKPIKITLYGREITIQELFDYSKTDTLEDMLLTESDIEVKNIIDRNPSIADIKAKTGGIDYINRVISKQAGSSKVSRNPTSIDYPTRIAKELMVSNSIKLFSIIEGESRSGKSVVLTKVLSELRNHRSLSWSIGVDLREVSLADNWKPRDLFSKALGPQESALFEKMLLKNPPMVNIVVDNINALPTETLQTSVLKYFHDLNKKHVGVVLSIPQSMTKILSSVDINPKKKRVITNQPLTSIEAESFLQEVWLKKFGLANKHKIGAYAKALTRATQAAKLPMNFDTLTQLSDLIESGDKSVFVEGGDFVSLNDFIADGQSNTLKLEKMLKSVEVNTYRLYERLTAHSMPPEITADYFGLRVLESFLPPTESNSPMALEVRAQIQKSQYQGTGADFELLQYDGSSGKHTFVYGKHAEFFASKVLVNHVQTDAKSFEATVTEILTDKKYRSLAEHINSYISELGSVAFDPILANINPENLYKALDNAFQHGFDEIGRGILEKMSPGGISAYFQADSNPHSFQNPARELGVISTIELSTVCSRSEIVFRRGMEKSILQIQTKTGNNIWKIEEFPRYLEEFLSSQAKPNLPVYKMLVENSPISALTEKFLNKLLFNVLEQGKFDNCKPIIEDLVRRGATPATYHSTPEKSLVHLAIKQHNPEFLQFAVEKWNIPIDGIGGSTLIALLDANPLSRLTQPHTWEMMEYVLEHSAELEIPPPSSDFRDVLKNEISVEDMASPAYKVLTGTEDAAALEKAVLEVAVSSEPLDKLSAKLRTYRRKYLLTTEPKSNNRADPNSRSLTEIVLRNRGLDTLSKFEQAAYERCVKMAFQADVKRGLSAKKISRIRRALIENIGTKADYTFTGDFINSELVQKSINQMALKKMNLRLMERLYENRGSEIRKYNVKHGVSQTRAELYPRVVDAPAYLGQVSEKNTKPSLISNELEQASNSLDPLIDGDIIPCMHLI